MNEQFDIYEYLSGLTGFYFDKAVLKRIAMRRGVLTATNIGDIDEKTEDLLTADLLLTAYLSPTSTPSITKQHNSFSQTIGSQTINSKKDIYNVFVHLYRKWGDEKLEEAEALDGGVQWLPY